MSDFDWTLNCGFDVMDHVLRTHEKRDSLRPLLQPLGFGFEVELGSRDWWVGGYSSINYQRPRFNAGLTGAWLPLEAADFGDYVRARLARGRIAVFQTEWTFVDYLAGRGWHLGSLHTAAVFGVSADGCEYRIRDRMATEHPAFGPDGYATVPAEVFREAFERRLTVLDYELTEPATPWQTELRELLMAGIDDMRIGNRLFAPGPHGHLATGLPGLAYAADTLTRFAPQFAADRQVKMLLEVRLVDGISAVLGDRSRLLRATQELAGGPAPGAEARRVELESALRSDLSGWRRAARVLARQGQQEQPDLVAAGAALRDTIGPEAAVVDAAEAWAATL
jgi:hypothetical protein